MLIKMLFVGGSGLHTSHSAVGFTVIYNYQLILALILQTSMFIQKYLYKAMSENCFRCSVILFYLQNQNNRTIIYSSRSLPRKLRPQQIIDSNGSTLIQRNIINGAY